MVGKILRTQSEAHVELAEYSCSVASLSYRGACACYGGSAKRKRRANRDAAGRLCVGERTEWHPGTIEADGAEHAVRSSKDAHRAMEDRRCDQTTDAGDGGVHPAQPAVGAAGNDHATEQLTGRSGSEFQALPQPGRAV